MFDGKFWFHLNSEDSFCPALPLATRKAKGGTMAIWEGKLDPYIRILPTYTSAVLPLLLSPPGLMPTAHITAEANISPKVNISARTPIMAME